MAIRFDVAYEPGATVVGSLGRPDGLSYDFADGAFRATPATPYLSLPEQAGLPGSYWRSFTPAPALPDGDYTLRLHDVTDGYATVGKGAIYLHGNDDATVFTVVVGTPTPTPTPSPSPSVTPSPTPTVTPSPSPSVTPSPSPTPSVTPSPSPTPSVTPSPSPTPSVTPTVTPSPSPTPSVTPTPTPTPSATPSPTPTPTPSASPPPPGASITVNAPALRIVHAKAGSAAYLHFIAEEDDVYWVQIAGLSSPSILTISVYPAYSAVSVPGTLTLPANQPRYTMSLPAGTYVILLQAAPAAVPNYTVAVRR